MPVVNSVTVVIGSPTGGNGTYDVVFASPGLTDLADNNTPPLSNNAGVSAAFTGGGSTLYAKRRRTLTYTVDDDLTAEVDLTYDITVTSVGADPLTKSCTITLNCVNGSSLAITNVNFDDNIDIGVIDNRTDCPAR